MSGDPNPPDPSAGAPVLHRVTDRADPWLIPAEALYRESFERRERREHLAEPLARQPFHLQVVLRDGEFAGFVTVWRFDAFVFLEHLATRQAFRGSGIGAAVVLHAIQNAPWAVLEAEPAASGSMAGRRLAWYQRLGFAVNPQAYRQPAYGPGLPEVPLHLLSRPAVLGDIRFDTVVRTLRREVYGMA